MKRKVIDNKNFPIRKVASVRPANNVVDDITRLIRLDCGHDVGLREGEKEPTEVPCYWCHKEGRP